MGLQSDHIMAISEGRIFKVPCKPMWKPEQGVQGSAKGKEDQGTLKQLGGFPPALLFLPGYSGLPPGPPLDPVGGRELGGGHAYSNTLRRPWKIY